MILIHGMPIQFMMYQMIIINCFQPDNDKTAKEKEEQKKIKVAKPQKFRSVHSMQDLSTMKNTKIFQKKEKPQAE